MNDPVTAGEFRTRLVALCARGAGRHLPRRRRDRHILFRGVLLTLDPGRSYGEKAFTRALAGWIESVGKALDLDPVSLRRALVDAGYVERDPAGTAYRIARSPVAGAPPFEEAVREIDPAGVVEEAREAFRRRRAAFIASRREG